MKEKTLVRTSIICSIIGLTVLYIISQTFEMDETTIDDAKNKLNENIKIKGIVTKVTESNKTIVMEITQPTSIKAVYFKENGNEEFEQGDLIEATGYIEEYNNEKQMIIEKLNLND